MNRGYWWHRSFYKLICQHFIHLRILQVTIIFFTTEIFRKWQIKYFQFLQKAIIFWNPFSKKSQGSTYKGEKMTQTQCADSVGVMALLSGPSFGISNDSSFLCLSDVCKPPYPFSYCISKYSCLPLFSIDDSVSIV